MRTAAGIITVLIIVVIIYLLLPPATKQAVQFWKPDYSMPPEASPASSPIAANTTPSETATPLPTSGFVAQATPLPTLRPNTSPSVSPNGSPRPTATASGQVASANTSLPGTGDILRDPILLVLTLIATSIAVVTGYRMTKYQ